MVERLILAGEAQQNAWFQVKNTVFLGFSQLGSPWFLFCLFEKTVYCVMEGVIKKRKEEDDACQYVVCVCVEGKLEYFFVLGSGPRIFLYIAWKQIYFLFLGPAEFC